MMSNIDTTNPPVATKRFYICERFNRMGRHEIHEVEIPKHWFLRFVAWVVVHDLYPQVSVEVREVR
jgi:hypothetical protein